MKNFAVIAFFLFCGLTLAQNNAGSLEFKSSEPIEVNSTSIATCTIVQHPLDPKTTPNLKVVIEANLSSNKTVQIGEWSLVANNDQTVWNVSFTSINKNSSEEIGVAVIDQKSDLKKVEFQLSLKLIKSSAEGNYFCSLEKVQNKKSEVLLKSKEVPTEKPIYYAELTVSTKKFTIEKLFTVDCKTVSTSTKNDSEIVQVAFFKNKEKLAVYELAKNESLSFNSTDSIKALTVSQGETKLQKNYQIKVKPLTKDAAGHYSCVATSETIKDKTGKRSFESNFQQVDNSARWALPSITFLLVSFAFFLHF